MLVIDNGDAIRGIAEVATQLDFIVNGYVGTTATQLADGQIGSTEGDLYLSSADGTVVTSITVVNRDSAARTFTLFLKPSGGTSRAISPVSLDLGIGHSFYTDGQRVVVLDKSGNVLSTTTVLAHTLGGSSHDADTLSNLNSKVSDATLVDTGDIILKALLTTQNDIITRNGSTPIRLNIGASRFVARLAAGNLVAATVAEILTLLGVEAGATADLTGDEIVTLLEALAGAAQLSHTKISDIGSTDHHTKYLNSEAKAAAVLAGAITDAETRAPTHDAVFDVKVTADAAQTAAEVDADILTHKNIATAHHTKYTDAEAVIQALAQKLDDFTVPDDNTDLDASTTKHGLFAKLLWDKLNAIEASAKDDQTGAEMVTLLEALGGGSQLSHDQLDDVSTSDHHTKYADAEAVSAVEAAGLTFAETKGIILDALLSGDGTWSGFTEAGIAGVTMAVGDLVYLSVADTRWELADADAVATAFGKLGICILAANDGAATNVLLWGKVRSSVFPTFTVGAPVHVGTTAGDVQVAAPTGTDKIVRIIGYGNTAEDLFFCPDNTYIKLA